mmetsp:Transcript_24598/g.54164  ORF Transcript_24598/g.54164 Transcript_24598/m.54164 type:complete len:521 (+) Transcript_24598:3-1565(+)
MNSYMVVSTGADSSSDEDGDGDYHVDNNDDGWHRSGAGPGAFYVDPGAFGGANGTEATNFWNGGVDNNSFEEIAAGALSKLDEEYRQIIALSEEVSSNDERGDEDLKAIAAGFDDRKDVIRQKQVNSDSVVQPEVSYREASETVVKEDRQQPKNRQVQRKNDVHVDTEAVRKAVENLSVKNKDAPFQQKFMIWAENHRHEQQQDDPPHTLIQMDSYDVFHKPKPTTLSRLASANLTRSATLAEALVRLSLLASFPSSDGVLLIDIVGADHVECDNASTIRKTFRPFLGWLRDYFLVTQPRRTIRVHFRLIGRELTTRTTAGGVTIDLLEESSSSTPKPLMKATATCHSGVYHEFLEEETKQPKGVENNNENNDHFDGLCGKATPDLAVAFNAGIWGYREWADTIQYLAQVGTQAASSSTEAGDRISGISGIPMVVTAYTLEECQEDQEVISKAITCSAVEDGEEGASETRNGYRAELLWESERNPFGSQVVRETKGSTQEYRENAFWQCWLLGRKTQCLS